jgi:hypothetical protein
MRALTLQSNLRPAAAQRTVPAGSLGLSRRPSPSSFGDGSAVSGPPGLTIRRGLDSGWFELSLEGQLGRRQPSPAQGWLPPGPFQKHLDVGIAQAVGAVGIAPPPRWPGHEQSYSASSSCNNLPHPEADSQHQTPDLQRHKRERERERERGHLCELCIANSRCSSCQNRVRPQLRRTCIRRP